jgi:hypothetical protein
LEAKTEIPGKMDREPSAMPDGFSFDVAIIGAWPARLEHENASDSRVTWG